MLYVDMISGMYLRSISGICCGSLYMLYIARMREIVPKYIMQYILVYAWYDMGGDVVFPQYNPTGI